MAFQRAYRGAAGFSPAGTIPLVPREGIEPPDPLFRRGGSRFSARWTRPQRSRYRRGHRPGRSSWSRLSDDRRCAAARSGRRSCDAQYARRCVCRAAREVAGPDPDAHRHSLWGASAERAATLLARDRGRELRGPTGRRAQVAYRPRSGPGGRNRVGPARSDLRESDRARWRRLGPIRTMPLSRGCRRIPGVRRLLVHQ